MHKVFYSDTIKTFAQAQVTGYEYYNNEVKVWAPGFRSGYAELFNGEIRFGGENPALAREAYEKVPEVFRDAFTIAAVRYLRAKRQELQKAEEEVNKAQLLVNQLDGRE